MIFTNRTPQRLHFSAAITGEAGGAHEIPPGEVLTLATRGPLNVAFYSESNVVRAQLPPNTMHMFVPAIDPAAIDPSAGAPAADASLDSLRRAPAKLGPIELREISLEGDDASAAAEDAAPAESSNESSTETSAEAAGPIDPQLAAGVLTLKVLVDDQQRAAPAYWKKRLGRRIDDCSRVLERQCGLKLEVVAHGQWQSDDGLQEVGDVLRDFIRRVDPAPARLAIGFVSQPVNWASGSLHQDALAAPLGKHLIMPEAIATGADDLLVEMLLHSLGHFLGATHSPEQVSVMRTDGLAFTGLPRGAYTFDPVNALVMARVAQEARRRGVPSLDQLAAPAGRQLASAYGTLRLAMPSDPAVAAAGEFLAANVRPAPPPAVDQVATQSSPPASSGDRAKPPATAPSTESPSTPSAFSPTSASTRQRVTRPRALPEKIEVPTADDIQAKLQALAEKIAGPPGAVADLQTHAIAEKQARWGYWGADSEKYSTWNRHSNRLIPVYTFGVTLDPYRGEHSPYRDEAALEKLYGRLPPGTLNPQAEYFDQTAVYHLQQAAAAQGKKHIILMVFDGMDWTTTRAAASYHAGRVAYHEGRGQGLSFQDYRGAPTDFGFCVTSPASDKSKYDVNAQRVLSPGTEFGGYDAQRGGPTPWQPGSDPKYALGLSKAQPHVVTDSASSATSMCAGIKTYNVAINVDVEGRQVETIAHRLQREGRAIGVVTSVPISHATPAAAYAHNVERHDYQDLARDLLGLKSVSHPETPLPGVDLLLGCGWGENATKDAVQGDNFVPGNVYLTAADLGTIDVAHGGKYRVAQRTAGLPGEFLLAEAALAATRNNQRLFGFFGSSGVVVPGKPGGHLPYRTANGDYHPVTGALGLTENYQPTDVLENPTLAQMTTTALRYLERDPEGFWLMIEAGDVDWANHDNNLDNSIGAVLSGDEAFQAVINWVEELDAWNDTALIVTADHGHHLVLVEPEAIAAASVKDREK